MSLNYVTHKLRAQSLAEGDTDGQEAEIGPAASTVPEEEEEDEEIQVGHIWRIQTIAQDFCVQYDLHCGMLYPLCKVEKLKLSISKSIKIAFNTAMVISSTSDRSRAHKKISIV